MSIRNAVLCFSLALPLALAGCSGDDETEVINCAADSECLEGSEICHPVGKVCVATCTIADDCPDTQKNCEEVKVSGVALTTEKVCQCTTSELCKGDDDAAEVVCSPVDNICEDKCTIDDDCAVFTSTNRECVDGACVPKATCSATSCTDPSASKCGEDGKCAACALDADCAHLDGLDKCDNGVCVAPACNANNKDPGANFGPDICAYGEFCNATNACVEVAAPTCSGAASHVWAKDAKPPVITRIVSATFSSTSDTTECGDGGPKLEVSFEFYAPNGITWNSGTERLAIVKFVSASNTTNDASNLFGTTKGAKSGTLRALQCGNFQASDLNGRWMYMESGAKGNAMCLQ